jgi:6-pyruvoyltetrahydropterin/6-carboxytetrahydropterin synthase
MEVAHQLHAGVPEGHKCRRLHGHRYILTITLSGGLDTAGMLVEYDAMDALVMPVIGLLDHQHANTLSERCQTREATAVSANPTVERMVLWLHARLPTAGWPPGTKVERIELCEDSRSSVEVARWI